MPGYEKVNPFVSMDAAPLVAWSWAAPFWLTGAGAGALGARGGWAAVGGAASRAAAERANGPAVASSEADAASRPTPFLCVVDTGTGILYCAACV